MKIRAAEETELDQLASIWHDGWQDAHSQILPGELARRRTLGSFRQRLQLALPGVRVSGPRNQPLGFCITKGDELYQLYVSANARGTGLARALLVDAEEHMSSRGTLTAWLACAIGNSRAAKFYKKNNWQRVGSMISELPTPEGVFSLEVWRYEKSLHEESCTKTCTTQDAPLGRGLTVHSSRSRSAARPNSGVMQQEK